MRLRRCAALWLEPRETARFDLGLLLAGQTGITASMEWFAHAPQLDAPVPVDAEDVALLGALSAQDWIDAMPLRQRHGALRIRRLLRCGLLVGRGKRWQAQRDNDERFRAQHWHGLAAVVHAHSRWQGRDAAQEVVDEEMDSAEGLRERFGAPPPALHDHPGGGAPMALPRAGHDDFDALLDARATCRNFDRTRDLPHAAFARTMERVFGARGCEHAAPDFKVLKKTSPSGGALHPTEAYLVVQQVAGIAPGLYHYRAGEHALQALAAPADLAAFALSAVAGQRWFGDAHVLVVLAPRFLRNHWKYRNHAKAYRAQVLDAGHLSQTLQLAATAAGLGAFVTAAINEVDIERAFGLTGFVDGPLAVCGFGPRADAMATTELDPNHKVWLPAPG